MRRGNLANTTLAAYPATASPVALVLLHLHTETLLVATPTTRRALSRPDYTITEDGIVVASWESTGHNQAVFECDSEVYHYLHHTTNDSAASCPPGWRTRDPERLPLATIAHVWRAGGIRREINVTGGDNYWLLGTEVRQDGAQVGTVQARQPGLFSRRTIGEADLKGVPVWLQVFLLLVEVTRRARSD
jgi:hypothetical protein